jgi:AcrR family transcriptional regulator
MSKKIEADKQELLPSRSAPRRQPTQARSRETVDKILAAAIKVVEKIGYNDTTTNHIAREAQLSVGSVYQYFPSKEAIFLALWDQQIQAEYSDVSTEFEELKKLPLEEFFLLTADRHIEAFANNTRLKLELLTIIPKFADDYKILDVRNTFAKLIEGVLEAHRDEIEVEDLFLAAQILVNTFLGNIQTYAAADPKKLRDPAFRRELARISLGYLRCKIGPLKKPTAN